MLRFFSSFLFTFFLLQSIYAGETVVIATNNYIPYTSKAGEGFIMDVVRSSFSETGVEVKFEYYPWKRCVHYVYAGKVFATTPFIKTRDRKEKFDFSDPLTRTYNVFFYNKKIFPNGFRWNRIEDFRKYLMGGTLGYWYMDEFKKNGLTVIHSSEKKNFLMLKKQRIDFVLIDELTGLKILQSNNIKNRADIRVAEKPFVIKDYHLMISRSYPSSRYLKDKFNKGLKIIKRKRLFSSLVKKYGIPAKFVIN